MSQGQKFVERPKVRFCQPSEDSSSSEKPDDKFNPNSNKPRIRSIVTLEEPFKLLPRNSQLPSTSKKNAENSDPNPSVKSTPNPQSSVEADSHKPSSSSNPRQSQNLPPRRNSGTTVCGGDKESTNKKCPKPCLPSTSHSTGAQSTTCKNAAKVPSSVVQNPAQVKSSAIIAKAGRLSGSKLVSRGTTPRTVPCTPKTAKKATTVADENKNPPTKPVARMNRPKDKILGKVAPSSSLALTSSNSKTASCRLKISKPGTKVWRSRSKSSPVKKTILRDVTGHSTNAHVGPGVARYYSQSFKMNMEKETPHIRPDIVSGEKLGRPEYNSIMCTIDELKKAQEERIVTDVQHLPLVYRNLVNEKVSAALDFSPDEAIYRNLVDLSINDNQLPSRLTRSKDPEPRHKDVVPKLSDFFTPTYSEEYCSAVRIRPSSPEVVSNWSAFAISDKIFGWKHDMDHCC